MLVTIVKDIWESRGLASTLVWRNIKSRYRQSFLGLFLGIRTTPGSLRGLDISQVQ